MRRRLLTRAGMLLVALTALAGCAGVAQGNQHPSPTSASPSPTPAPTPTPDPVTHALAGMTLAQKITQLMMVGFVGPTLTPQEQQQFQLYRFGSAVIYAGDNNGSTPAQVQALIAAVKQAEGPGPGAILTTNQEGGTVCFTGSGVYCAPGAQEEGAAGVAAVSQSYTQMAQGLKQIGIQSGLAPDADVWDGDPSQSLADRSFGTEPAAVAQDVSAAVQADHQVGVMAVAKHFPGEGSAGDTETYLPTDDETMQQLDTVNFPPFQAAIAARVDMIMVGHVLIPAIDPTLPASLSPQTYQILRQQLGYQGVLVTDDLSMGAITPRYSEAQAGLMALQAGADMVMFASSIDAAIQALQLITQAVQSGQLPMAQIDASVTRVLQLKQAYGLLT
ncbi:MAG: glycoside hydrolase family 3 N-terminal domain-containing protein [Candidatus Dormibacteraceae bacterium]